MNDWWYEVFAQARQTLTIQDAGGREVAIAYGEAGTGKPLVLLHGIGSWSYNWRKTVKPLAQQFRVICPDAKGYGFSQAAPPPEIVGHQIIEVARIIQALTDQPVGLVGESLGALTALAIAQQYPELVEQLVLINAPVFPQELPNWGMRGLSYLPLELVQWFDQTQLIRPLTPLIQALTHLARREVVADPACITDEEIYWLTYPYINNPGTITQFAADLQQAALEIQRFQQGQPNLIQRIQQDLPNVTCPTLILWADQDQWFPLEEGHRLHESLPHAQFQVIAQCGHNASSTNPDAVNAAMLAFLRTETASRSGHEL